MCSSDLVDANLGSMDNLSGGNRCQHAYIRVFARGYEHTTATQVCFGARGVRFGAKHRPRESDGEGVFANRSGACEKIGVFHAPSADVVCERG